jgi:hypothetical protein
VDRERFHLQYSVILVRFHSLAPQRQALYIVSLAIVSADYGDDEDDEDDSYEMGITITVENQSEEASEDLQLITEEDSSAPGDAEGEEDEAP